MKDFYFCFSCKILHDGTTVLLFLLVFISINLQIVFMHIFYFYTTSIHRHEEFSEIYKLIFKSIKQLPRVYMNSSTEFCCTSWVPWFPDLQGDNTWNNWRNCFCPGRVRYSGLNQYWASEIWTWHFCTV